MQTPHAFGDSRAEQFWLYGPLGLQLWNSLRMLDHLAARPDVDARRIGMTGASGGATQTFTLMAVDDRIAVAAPVNMVSFIMQGGSPCENAPGLRVGTQNVEIAALMAPKPMLAVAATGDWTRNVPREEFPALQKVYELYSQADEVDAQQFDFPHNYNRTSREAVYRFLRKHLLERPDEGPVTESVAHGLTREELLARPQWTPPADSLDAAGVYRWWREQSLATWRAQSRADRRRRLRDVLQVEWPEGPAATPAEGPVTLAGPHNTPVPGTWLPGKGNGLVLAVHPDGAEAARQAPEVEREIQRGAGMLALNVFGRAGQPVPPGEGTKFFHTFHRSLDAERVQDVLTGLAFLASRGKRGVTGPEIRLVGLGTQGQIWATLAAAVQPLGTQVRLVTPAPPIADEEALERVVFVPGLLHAGGLAGALDLATGRATEPPRRGRIPW